MVSPPELPSSVEEGSSSVTPYFRTSAARPGLWFPRATARYVQLCAASLSLPGHAENIIVVRTTGVSLYAKNKEGKSTQIRKGRSHHREPASENCQRKDSVETSKGLETLFSRRGG